MTGRAGGAARDDDVVAGRRAVLAADLPDAGAHLLRRDRLTVQLEDVTAACAARSSSAAAAIPASAAF